MQKQSHHIIYRRLVLAMIAVAVMAAITSCDNLPFGANGKAGQKKKFTNEVMLRYSPVKDQYKPALLDVRHACHHRD